MVQILFLKSIIILPKIRDGEDASQRQEQVGAMSNLFINNDKLVSSERYSFLSIGTINTPIESIIYKTE